MEPQTTSPRGQIVAFIDIGTNSIRLLLVETHPDLSYRVITQQKETVRLGEGEFTHQRLQPEAIRRAVLVCQKFAGLARAYQADEIVTVATAATRDALNQDEFVEQLRREADLDVKVISGREEARLIYCGVAGGVNIGERNACFIDIGGGSTEISVGNQQQYFYLDSLKLGAIRLSALFLAGRKGSVTPAAYTALQRYVRDAAIRTAPKVRQFPITYAFGSSGTIENLGEIAARYFYKRRLQKDDVLAYDQLKEVVKMLCALPLEERRNIPGINPERADIIVGGAAILDTLMLEFGLPEIQISDRGLRDGMLLDYLSRTCQAPPFREISIRERSIRQLGRACRFDETHANQVAGLALQLYDSAVRVGLLAPSEWQREMLYYAALLHDIGTFLTYNNHHAHTYYLIRNADLLGFNQAEIAIVATIAFYHRKTAPRRKHSEFALLDKISQKIVAALSILLRLAESLDRSHSGIIHQIRFRAQDKDVVLEIAAQQDCQLELWGLKNHDRSFSEVFDKNLTFECL